MKRSEAIEKIASELSSLNNYSLKEHATIDAEHVLSLVEKEIGMIPPRYRGELYDIHAWEEEND